MYIPSTTWTWSFMLMVIAQVVMGLALEGYVFAEFQTHADVSSDDSRQLARTIYTYLSLFVFGFLYQIYLTWDALRLNNTIQVIGICWYNLGLLVYAAVEVDQVRDVIIANSSPIPTDEELSVWHDIRPCLVALPIILAAVTCVLSVIAWRLYDEFAWSIYKNISADLRMKKRYLVYQVYITLLKFDFFFFLSFSVQFLVMVDGTTDVEMILTVVALIITIPILFLAGYLVRRESASGMCGIIFLYFCAMAYFMFKLVRMYDSDANRIRQYAPARKGLTTFAVITILLLILTILNAAWCMLNFGHGLKQHVNKSLMKESDEAKLQAYDSPYSGSMPLGSVSKRMTID